MEGDSNEEMQAGAGSEAGANAVPEKPEKRKPQALVSGDGGSSAGGEGAEQQGEPTSAAGEGAGVVSDGKRNGSGSVGVHSGSGGHADLRNGSGADPSGSVGGVHPGGAIVCAGRADVSDGNSAADGGGTAQDADGIDVDAGFKPAYFAFSAAVQAYEVALQNADCIRRLLLATDDTGPDAVPPSRPVKFEMFVDMAAFVRKIGERATADVVGQQLRILKHRENAELAASEAVAVSAFIHVLRAMDGMARDEQAAIVKAEAAKARVAPEPLPIGETTMEPVDGPMDTWGM